MSTRPRTLWERARKRLAAGWPQPNPVATPEEPARAESVPEAPRPLGHIAAAPNPLVLCSALMPREVGIYWMSRHVDEVEVRVGAPDGDVLSRTGPGKQREQVGEWLRDGLTLYLQDASPGNPCTAERTLATVTLQVVEPALEAEAERHGGVAT